MNGDWVSAEPVTLSEVKLQSIIKGASINLMSIDAMLPCVPCSVIDHIRRQNVIRTEKWHTKPHEAIVECGVDVLTSSTFSLLLWSITEQTQDSMECICSIQLMHFAYLDTGSRGVIFDRISSYIHRTIVARIDLLLIQITIRIGFNRRMTRCIYIVETRLVIWINNRLIRATVVRSM